MLRTRLLWFTLGFGSATAAMSHFVFRDLWLHRQNLSSTLKQQFEALDTRVSNLEHLLPHPSNSTKE
ncbi:uncharacterized protein LOC141682717 [Apium graveolens]|uniref:uncharacterized protein LOC141682717 n=1 Tax=Apium graveolens TaxID=4045 RepID=UPI003D797D2F